MTKETGRLTDAKFPLPTITVSATFKAGGALELTLGSLRAAIDILDRTGVTDDLTPVDITLDEQGLAIEVRSEP